MHSVITLVERDFLYGSAVLLNSLIANGFTGEFVIGHRLEDDLPNSLYHNMLRFSHPGVSIRWLPLRTELHFTNYKALFIDQVFESSQDATKVSYIDPDIVVLCPWSWINKWCDYGPVMCADVNWYLPSSHPTRYEWRNLLARLGLPEQRDLDTYFNGGFLSVHRRDREFVRLWQRILQSYGAMDVRLDVEGDIHECRAGGRWYPMQAPDQDALNLVAMVWPNSICTFGPDAMGFTQGWRLLPHAVGPDKPWRGQFIRRAISGFPPRLVDKAYLSYSKNPINIYPRPMRLLIMLGLTLASLLGRFYRRA